jgi:neutral trehalase
MSDLEARCIQQLRDNDHEGHSTLPSSQLYPHQWNWDSAFAAIGWMHVDPMRAVTELKTLLAAQWSGGMVPHIVFHPEHEEYEPGPRQWETAGAPGAPPHRRTTSITQPPIAATAARAILEHCGEPVEHELRALVPFLDRWHAWFARERVLQPGTGVAIVHPWESGMDNAPRWDEPLAAVPDDEPLGFERADLKRADPATRPTDAEYRRYMRLVRHVARCGFDLAEAARTSPFRVADVSMTAILHRAEQDLIWLGRQLSVELPEAEGRLAEWTAALRGTDAALWTEAGYRDLDLAAGRTVDVGGAYELVPLYCTAPTDAQISTLVERLVGRYAAPHPVPTLPADHPRFDGKLYWRGPTWLNVNWLIIRGLQTIGQTDLAKTLADATIALVEAHGPREHYDPHTGEPHGATGFAWSAALALDLVRRPVD